MTDRKAACWQPQFDGMSPRQEELARLFCVELAGLRGNRGSPDPVRLLEMAQALYEAERADAAHHQRDRRPQAEGEPDSRRTGLTTGARC